MESMMILILSITELVVGVMMIKMRDMIVTKDKINNVINTSDGI